MALAVFDIGVEQWSPCGGAELHGLFEPLDPQLPQNVTVAIVDGEVWRITLRLLEKPFCDIIVVRHHEREHFVQVVSRIEDRRRLVSSLAPDDGKPFAWRDHLRTNKHAGDKTIEFFEQHSLLAKGEEFILKLLEMAQLFPHEASTSREGDRRFY